MSKPELTKQLLASTLKKLASGKHLDKISISEIVAAAGLNRQTFYYHFQDKQELICWIFDTDIARIMDEHR
ncbi:MAG: TetR family transcriptional regulator, partial [Christensenellaceae bacterium]|nr:TetR family transcriptional regulator [Christensenellaceae bacterium]